MVLIIYLQIRGEEDTELTIANDTKLVKNTLLGRFSILQHQYSRAQPTLTRHIKEQKLINDPTVKFDCI